LTSPTAVRAAGPEAEEARTGRVPTAPSTATGEPGRRSSLRSGLWAVPVYFVVQLALLAGLRAVAPRFFWFDDAQIQFTPMSWWLGRHLAGGSLPLLDPDQGMAGNLTADMQNGVLDVIRWPFLLWAGRQDDLLLVATVHGWLAVLVLGWASLTLLLNHRVRPSLAIAGAVGVSTSGFFLWWGSAWSPSMWSLAALIWLWAALSSTRWYAPIGIGLAAAAVVCAGNPYILPLLPVLLGFQAHERWRALGRDVLRERRTWVTLLALLAGAALSLPTVINGLDVAGWMWRLPADETVGASGGGTNVLDIFLGGTTLLNSPNIPMFSTAVIALPLLALVDWRRAIRGPGVPTAAALWVTSVLWTQLPFYFLGLRIPFRLLSAAQISFGLLALLAFTAAMLVTRRRLRIAAGLLLLQFVVAVMRAPVLWGWHVLSLALAASAVLAVVLLVRSPAARLPSPVRPWIRPAAAAMTILAGAAPLLIQLGLQSAVQERYETIVPGADQRADLYRPHTMGYGVGTTVSEFRAKAFATDTSLTVYGFGAFGDGNDRGWSGGILGGNLNLIADLRPGYGSLAVWPKGVQQYLVADYQGSLTADQPGLLVVPEGSDVPWVDLLSSNRVVLGVDDGTVQFVPQPIRDYFEQNWNQVSSRNGWTEYERRESLPGRVSLSPGAGVSVVDAARNDGVATLGEAFERYTVSTGEDGGRLVFRTPYWNGFRATVDGRPVEVSAFAGSVLQVELPPGLSAAALEIEFAPVGARILPAAVVLGGVLLLVSVLVALRSRRPGAVHREG
jgi:hypothetical protein